MNPAIIASIIALLFFAAPADARVSVRNRHITRAPIAVAAPVISVQQSNATTPQQSAPISTQQAAQQPATQSPVISAPAPVTAQSPADFVTQVEQEVLRLTNVQRAQNGLAPLAADAPLASIARAHSADMLAKNYFTHNDLTGCSASCRMTNAGYAWQAMAENIHAMWGYTMSPSETANKIVTDWMNSPGHRANILNGTYTRAGVGIAQQETTIYSTTDYALPR